LLGLIFGARASDSGLRQLVVILTVASAILLLTVLAERDLRGQTSTSSPLRQEHLPAVRP
jgi:hypothetical protein